VIEKVFALKWRTITCSLEIMARSLVACSEGIKLAESALTGKGWSREVLAGKVTVENSRGQKAINKQTIDKFFAGKTVDRPYFVGICKTLELDWEVISGINKAPVEVAPSESLDNSDGLQSIIQSYLNFVLKEQNDPYIPTDAIQQEQRILGKQAEGQSEAKEEQIPAIPNSERIHALSGDHVSSIKLDINEKSRVSAPENFEFGIAEQIPQPVMKELRKYALGDRREHVILSGRPGSGKSKALQQLRLTLAQEGLVPVLVKLKGDQSIPEMIQGEFRRAKQKVSLEQIDDWLLVDQLVLLLDGVNEIPNDNLQRKLESFRQDNSTVPMIFTTRDFLVCRDLGIRRRLEMKPLSKLQMREFAKQRSLSPVDAETLLEQLDNQLREIAETPLFLTMLCDIFRVSETREIPKSKGELFREFDHKYEKIKGLTDFSANFRRFKPELLQHLAFTMMKRDLTSSNTKKFWLTIDRKIAEKEIEKFLNGCQVANSAIKAKEWIENLTKYHLLQNSADLREVEFPHQLFHEYYAAEKLLRMLSDSHSAPVTKQRFQHCYLNYSRWTEAIGIALSLTDNKDQSTMIVESAMSIDLLLGSKLIGSMQLDFQKNLIDDLCKKEIDDWLKIYLLGYTRSTESITKLLSFLESDDLDIAVKSVAALRKINDSRIIPELKARMDRIEKYIEPNIKLSWLGNSECKELSFKAVKLEVEIKKLIVELSPEADEQIIDEVISDLTICTDYSMERNEINKIIVVSTKKGAKDIEGKLLLKLEESNEINEINHLSSILSDLQSKEASSILVKRLNESDFIVIQALGYFDDETSTVALVKLLSHSDENIRDKACKILIDSRRIKATSSLVDLLENQDFYIRFNSAIVLAEFNNEISIKVLVEGLNHERHEVRAESAKLLGKINPIETKCWLVNALKDPVYYVRRNAAISLANSGFKEALPELFKALSYCYDPIPLVFSEEDLANPGNNDIINQWKLENYAYNYKSINIEIINALGNNAFDTEEVHIRLWEVLRKGNKFAVTALAKFRITEMEFGITKMASHLIEILGTNDYEVQLNQIIGLITDLINQSEPSQRNSMILDIIGRLNDLGTHKKYYFVEKLAIVLTKVDSEYLIHYLPELSEMLNRNMGEQILWIIESIQASCGFYNYDIHCSPPVQTQANEGECHKVQIKANEVKIFENVQNYHESSQNST
jgi:HEAT repeats